LVLNNRQGNAVQYVLADPRIIQSLDLLRELLAEQIQTEAAITSSAQEAIKPSLRSK
jgi:hypothetical protein